MQVASRIEPLEARIAPAAVIELSALDGANGFLISGEMLNDQSGWSVSSAGDVNADGFDDLIIGAFGADPNGDDSGASYVVFGKAGGFSDNLNLSALDGTNGFRLSGVAGDGSGTSVRGAGDVNGDGFDDLIIGAPGAVSNGVASGASYVVFGKADGFSANLDLSTVDGTNGFKISGVAAGDRAGGSVSGAGDVNGDGFDDLIIGATGAEPRLDSSGVSYVVFGKASGFSANLNLSTLDGTSGFKISRVPTVLQGERFGQSVSGAGDVNGDGFDDLIIGAAGQSGGAGYSTSYVVFGKAGGFSANLNLSALGTNGFKFSGISGLAVAVTNISVSGAGDVNGDGFDDLIMGAAGAIPFPSGESYVIFGKAGGFSANLHHSELDGTNGFKISGEEQAHRAGFSVSGAGDVNGDGFDDLIIGGGAGDHPQ